MLPKYLEKWIKEPITFAVDTREKTPLDLKRWHNGTIEKSVALAHGDYSLYYPNMILDVCIERKSLDDLVGSIKKPADDEITNNFKKELIAMRGYKYKLVVIECNMEDVLNHAYRSAMNPNSVLGFISYWMGEQQIPFLFAGDHNGASRVVANMLYNIAEKEIKLSLLSGKIFPDVGRDLIARIGKVNDDIY